MVAAACATALLLVAVLWMTFMTWPWPTTVCVGLVVGFVCGLILGDRRADLELVYQRKDAAVEGAMDVAFSAQQLEQRISGEHPEGDVEQYDWAAEDDIPELPQPPTYLRRLW
ncbi:MAG TPA: hypothetical protein VK611_24910 [Acidimicrobiales bacterium]|nr:hypothetical protein [Acidimicrobiales bacterium]